MAIAVAGFALARTLHAGLERQVARRLLGMTTASDLRPIRVPAVPGRSAAEHGSYRGEPGKGLVVLAMHDLEPARRGEEHRAWVRYGSRWIGLLGMPPDVDGSGLAYGEDPAFADMPDEILVTLEGTGRRGAEPSGTPVLRWLGP